MIVQVLIQEGDPVAAGQSLMILEAMKMEHTITAPYAGTVQAIHYRAGEQVQEGMELLVIAGEE